MKKALRNMSLIIIIILSACKSESIDINQISETIEKAGWEERNDENERLKYIIYYSQWKKLMFELHYEKTI